MIHLALLFSIAIEAAPQSSNQEPRLSPQAAPSTATPGMAASAIDAGLAAFRRRNYRKAEIEFRQAVDADPGSAAATFYLGYTYYKMTEPRRRLTPEKERAKELFAKAFELDPTFRPSWGSK